MKTTKDLLISEKRSDEIFRSAVCNCSPLSHLALVTPRWKTSALGVGRTQESREKRECSLMCERQRRMMKCFHQDSFKRASLGHKERWPLNWKWNIFAFCARQLNLNVFPLIDCRSFCGEASRFSSQKTWVSLLAGCLLHMSFFGQVTDCVYFLIGPHGISIATSLDYLNTGCYDI